MSDGKEGFGLEKEGSYKGILLVSAASVTASVPSSATSVTVGSVRLMIMDTRWFVSARFGLDYEVYVRVGLGYEDILVERFPVSRR